MRVVIAIDSFKGSLSTVEAGNAVANGVKRVFPEAETAIFPVADGGEGTTDAIVSAVGGTFAEITVHNPLMQKIKAKYSIIPQTKTAVIEMAAAAGITLIDDKDKNPLHTTTFGVGEMILDAIDRGCRHFVLGIGGSATNDGGVGMLQALGFSFLNAEGKSIEYGAKGLESLQSIETNHVPEILKTCTFQVACDVTNPLCGKSGCSAVYGPQKGATAEMIEKMDRWLKNYASLTKAVLPEADENAPGAGAAGGMGFALSAYLNGKMQPGIQVVTEQIRIEEKIKSADFVITGEGRLDGQSVMGKVPVGIAKLAKKYQKPVLAFAGCVTQDAPLCNEHGIDAFFPILKAPCSLEAAMDKENAKQNLADTVCQVFRVIRLNNPEL